MLRSDEVGRRQVLHRPQGADMQQPAIARGALIGAFASTFLSIVIGLPTIATADEGGVSFWLPGFFGSLAAAPQQPVARWRRRSAHSHSRASTLSATRSPASEMSFR